MRNFEPCGFARDADAATVQFNDLLHDRQPQTCAAFLRRKERFEDAVARGLVHSLSLIRDRYPRIRFRRLTVAVRSDGSNSVEIMTAGFLAGIHRIAITFTKTCRS